MNRFEGTTVLGQSAGLPNQADFNANGTMDSETWR